MRFVNTYLSMIIFMSFAASPQLFAVDPYAKSDQSWITISGTAVSPFPDGFTLDYGEGVIRVELDDEDLKSEGKVIRDGNLVTVTGKIDDDLFSMTSIEADSVYVQDLNRYIWASAKDEERWIEHSWDPIKIGHASIRGKVETVNPTERKFTVKTGTKVVTVDTVGMRYNPLDEYGHQKISPGDQVSVAGQMTKSFIDGRELEAKMVITLVDANLARHSSKQVKDATSK
ncbi:MAG: hypothetical protein H0W78_04735 [Planctomycetes bacterium]|nr:hypothetical protein [Planctomycetota bacterium]